MTDDIQKTDDEFERNDEDQAMDEHELEDIEENSAQIIKKLKQQLKESEKEKMACLEDLQRAKADFLNGKRRIEEEKKRDKERITTTHVEKLIPLSDSFQMAKSNKEAWDSIDATWRKGIESIENQLSAILTSYGVSSIDPQGEMFDPNLHEAMTNVPVSKAEDHHKIMHVIQNGYIRKIGDKTELIRPARVTVGEYSGS